MKNIKIEKRSRPKKIFILPKKTKKKTLWKFDLF
jgi:hypothetical protein